MSKHPPRADTSRRSLIRPSTSPGSRRSLSSSRKSTVSSRLKSARSNISDLAALNVDQKYKYANEIKGENKAIKANRLLQLNKIANRLSDQAYRKYNTMYDLYRELDTDGDGAINFEEFDQGLKKCGFHVNRRDTEEIYKMIDRDNSRTIDYAEFTKLLEPEVCQFSTGRLALHANIRMDADVSEFQVAEDNARKLPEVAPFQAAYLRHRVQEKVAVRTEKAEVASQLLHAFRFVDPRKDGYITYDEFRTAVGMGKKGVPGMNIGLNEKQVEELISICDIDRDGCISLCEFISALTKTNTGDFDFLTQSRMDVEQRLEKYAKDQTLDEFKKIKVLTKTIKDTYGQIPNRTTPLTTEQIVERTLGMLKRRNRARGGLRKAFQAYDQDRSGKIEIDEFRNILTSMNCNLSNEQFTQLWKRFDKDGDGTVQADEFCDAVFRDNEVAVTSLGQRGLSKFTRAGKVKLMKQQIKEEEEHQEKQKQRSSTCSTAPSSLTASLSSSSFMAATTSAKDKDDQRASTSHGIRHKRRNNKSMNKSRSTGHLFDPLEWSLQKKDQEMGSTFLKGRPETREVKKTGEAPSSRYDTNMRQERKKQVTKLYANGMRPSTAGMTHTASLMKALEPMSRTSPFRRQYSPAQGLHMTVNNFRYPQFKNDRSRFVTTYQALNELGYQASDHHKRLRKSIRFDNGLDLQNTYKHLTSVHRQLKNTRNQNNLRNGAKSKLHNLRYVMNKELNGPCRRPGKRMWHHEYMPGAVTHHRPSPHPW